MFYRTDMNKRAFVGEEDHGSVCSDIAVEFGVAEIVYPFEVSPGGYEYFHSVGTHLADGLPYFGRNAAVAERNQCPVDIKKYCLDTRL